MVVRLKTNHPCPPRSIQPMWEFPHEPVKLLARPILCTDVAFIAVDLAKLQTKMRACEQGQTKFHVHNV
ncbi:hypothetical protein RvY_16716 [Ramazzottius varieornatus]|uniref:Uncharacterized protein n=1 Tax=Ramazzottius varieornatus TaxID=947166 RepID=A0A1D1W0L7_RAMVA|nr:hypothetical protein RvY_16716 [Ramazzottius varieornatus]